MQPFGRLSSNEHKTIGKSSVSSNRGLKGFLVFYNGSSVYLIFYLHGL